MKLNEGEQKSSSWEIWEITLECVHKESNRRYPVKVSGTMITVLNETFINNLLRDVYVATDSMNDIRQPLNYSFINKYILR